MLINKLGYKNTEFRKKIKLRIWFSAALIVLGALTVSAVYYFGLFGKDFTSGFYFGLGFGLMGAGIATILKNLRYLKNADRFKAAETADQDERNRYITSRTWSVSAFIMLVLIYIAIIITGIYNVVVFSTLLVVLGAFFLVLLIVKTTLKKIY